MLAAHERVAQMQLDERGLEPGRLAGVDQRREVVEQQPGRLEPELHVDELVRHGLEAADRRRRTASAPARRRASARAGAPSSRRCSRGCSRAPTSSRRRRRASRRPAGRARSPPGLRSRRRRARSSATCADPSSRAAGRRSARACPCRRRNAVTPANPSSLSIVAKTRKRSLSGAFVTKVFEPSRT